LTGFGFARHQHRDPLPTVTAAGRATITDALHRGAHSLFTIGGLSLINTIILLSGFYWIFVGGLGAVLLASGLAASEERPSSARWIALIVSAAAFALFTGLGILARRGRKAAFLMGIALYALDTALLLFFHAWIMVAVHGYILWWLYRGFASCSELHAFDRPAARARGASA
jgi:hypothetical protein